MAYILIILAFLLAHVLTWLVLRYGESTRLLDYPNARSSHSIPTPRGGGLSVAITCSLCVVFLCWVQAIELHLGLALVVGGGFIAAIGFWDDRGALSVKFRISVHIAAAIFATYMLEGLPAVQFGERLIDLGVFGDVLGVMGIIWVLNLFNFMDGIDGIAASEAIFMAASGAGIAYVVGVPSTVMMVAWLLAASCAGFLVWNWPPAKIFMGDVCSGYLGYVISVLAIAAARESPVALFVWLTLGGVFFVDSTTTLIRRLIHGERVYQAHRSHAYQRLSRRWGSHLRVTILVLCINAFWLLPMAWLCIKFPPSAWWISLVALGPLAILAVIAGAGQTE